MVFKLIEDNDYRMQLDKGVLVDFGFCSFTLQLVKTTKPTTYMPNYVQG
jgi:hypothetical protein